MRVSRTGASLLPAWAMVLPVLLAWLAPALAQPNDWVSGIQELLPVPREMPAGASQMTVDGILWAHDSLFLVEVVYREGLEIASVHVERIDDPVDAGELHAVLASGPTRPETLVARFVTAARDRDLAGVREVFEAFDDSTPDDELLFYLEQREFYAGSADAYYDALRVLPRVENIGAYISLRIRCVLPGLELTVEFSRHAGGWSLAEVAVLGDR